MKCNKCNSTRILVLSAKCSDCCSINIGNTEHDGYVPDDLGIGGGDYVDLHLCLQCGQAQGKFPLPVSSLEKDFSDEELQEFFGENFSEGELFQKIYSSRKERILKEAHRFGAKLGSYVQRMFDCYCDMDSTFKAPSVSEFIEMYRRNSLEP